MFYFGVGRGGAHIMAAFSRDLLHWTSHPEPLYKAGGHPGGLDRQFAHKISLVYNPANDTFYLYYCAVGNQGRCIGLLTSRTLPSNPERKAVAPISSHASVKTSRSRIRGQSPGCCSTPEFAVLQPGNGARIALT